MTPPKTNERERIAGRVIFCLGFLAIAAFIIDRMSAPPDIAHFNAGGSGEASHPDKMDIPVTLRRGAFTISEFPSKKEQTTAIIIFGSGDGGWRNWEEKVCRALQNGGFDVIGINCADYAHTDYNLDILQSDYATIAQTAAAPFRDHVPPLIIGGYSMGAEQAIAVAGGPHPPPGMVGLLLISPESRGRYGLRSLDQIDIPPVGSGTFSMQDFAKTMANMRIVQWHGGYDPTDSTTWLGSLTVPHKEFDYPDVWHDYSDACPDFLRQLVDSISWILNPPSEEPAGEKNKVTP